MNVVDLYSYGSAKIKFWWVMWVNWMMIRNELGNRAWEHQAM